MPLSHSAATCSAAMLLVLTLCCLLAIVKADYIIDDANTNTIWYYPADMWSSYTDLVGYADTL